MTRRRMSIRSLRLGSSGATGSGVEAQSTEAEELLGGDTQGVVAVERRSTPVMAAPRLLRFPMVRERTGLSRSTIWRLERNGSFPTHRRLSSNAVGWLEDEIADWIEALPKR